MADNQAPQFKQDFNAKYAVAERMSPCIERVLCNNPSPYTYTGTGTYLVGNKSNVAVIDPGPMMPEHGEAILNALNGRTISHIIVTHTHADHSPLAGWLKEKTEAKTYGFGPHGAGRKGGLAEEEVEAGADKNFIPDIEIEDGTILTGDGWTLQAIHTPGHTANHICYHFKEENILFVGDHIMGWATTVISPPDGDMRDYLASLKKTAAINAEKLAPTHGPWIEDSSRFIRGIITHRRMREGQILKHLNDGADTIDALVTRMYKDVDKRLHPAAARSVLAHMIALVDEGRVMCNGQPTLNNQYTHK